MPDGKIDAVSTLTHELGHILGFTGWHNDETGELGVVASPFDSLITVPEGSNLLYLTGERATGAYGGLVSLTEGNTSHIGNRSGLPGDDLLNNLMNGVVGRLGARRWPQPMDFAILADLGYEVTLPTWLEGDLNADGVVNAADYTVWRDNQGATGQGIAGDGNLDRVVNSTDLALWRDDFGFQFFMGGGTSIPEPTSGLIVIGLLVGLACCSKRAAARSTGCLLSLPV